MMRRARGSGWSHKGAALMIAVALGLSASSCAGHAVLGTTSSPCFQALPAAADAVSHRGTLIGVRLEAVSRLRHLSPGIRFEGTRVCLVAFRGDFGPASVQSPFDTVSGPYAMVIVKPDGSKVLGTVVTRRLPQRFRHL
jgi:hypothetical protein